MGLFFAVFASGLVYLLLSFSVVRALGFKVFLIGTIYGFLVFLLVLALSYSFGV